MSKNLISSTAKIIGGSAVAAIGFSFGRDIYKSIKKRWKKLLILIILFLAILGAFTGGVWISRNYKHIFDSMKFRLLSLIVIFPSYITLLYISYFSILGYRKFISSNDSVNVQNIQMDAVFDSVLQDGGITTMTFINNVAKLSSSTENVIFAVFIFATGMLVGFAQRSKRKKVWAAEDYNEEFMENNSLLEHEDKTIEDTANDITYRVDHIGTKRITLMPLGKRGKRAYINIQEDGLYTEFTGLV